MRYVDVDLWIDPQVDEYYPVRAHLQSNGDVQGKMSISSLEEVRGKMSDLTKSIDDATRKKIGGLLFDVLFSGAIGDLYKGASKQVDQQDNAGVRIRLRIAPPEVAELSWELLFDASRDCFLSTSTQILFTRYVDLEKPANELTTSLPIRILVIVPKRSESSIERRLKMASNLGGLGNAIEIRVLDTDATLANINRELTSKQFHIIHFVGEGVFVDKEACLLLDDSKSQDQCSVTAKDFSYFFKDYSCLRLIVLQSSSGAKPSPSLRSVAEELVQLGTPAAISTRGGIDEGTRIFAQALYLKLCVGYEQGQVDIAVSHARKRLIAEVKNSAEFASPILFMHSPDGVIFKLEAPTIPRVNKVEKVAISVAPRVIAMALILSFFVFVASHTKLLSLLRVDEYLSGAMRLWTDRPEGTLNSKVMLIIAEQDKNDDLGSVVRNVKWRQYHATLLKGFTSVQKKPKVIVLDLRFDLPETTFLEDVANAIRSAQNEKIRVVGGKEIDNDGEITKRSIFPPVIDSAIGDSWGDVEAGGLIDLPLLSEIVYINEYEIASLPPGTPIPAPEIEVRPSIALKAVMQYFETPDRQVKSYFNEDRSQVIVKATNGDEIKQIPVIRKGISLDMLMDYVPKKSTESNSKAYADVHKWANSTTDKTSEWQLETLFADAIVIIGYNTDSDRQKIIGDEERSGVEVHANAISNILNDVYIPQISRRNNFAVIVIMIGVGILLQTVLKRWLPGDWTLKLPFIKDWVGEIKVPTALLAAVVLYLLIAYVVYSKSRLSFDIAYHLAALLFGYWLIAIFRKRLKLDGSEGGNLECSPTTR